MQRLNFFWLGQPQLNKIHNPALILNNGYSVPPTASTHNAGFIFSTRCVR